jgi:hypothetical protein
MKALITLVPMARAFDVRLWQDAGDGRVMLWQPAAPGSDWGGGWTDVDPNADTPVSFRIPEQALEALVSEASSILPASDATVEHLADTRAVRDRLLTLVEAFAIDDLGDAAQHVTGGGAA